jgi:ABC-type branched-subunit amino acid transport system ATPase component
MNSSEALLLPSLRIAGYRAIRELAIPALGRVNLFVGRNNVGKTALLEAIRLYHSGNPRAAITSLVRERTGLRSRMSATRRGVEWSPLEIESLLQSVEGLFHGSFAHPTLEPIQIRATPDDPDALNISLVGLSGDSDKLERAAAAGESLWFPETPVLEVSRGGRRLEMPLELFMRGFWGGMLNPGNSKVMFINPSGFDRSTIGALWDRAVESGSAPTVEDALRTIVPEVQRLYRLSENDAQGDAFFLELRGARRPVPINSMGDGTNRVLGLTLALIRATGGVLLVDEVENGLHYSVLVDVWRAMLDLAERLQVQVFATTHSWESIVAFQYVANQSPADGMLYRLEPDTDGHVHVERYTERDLAIAAEHAIEVR